MLTIKYHKQFVKSYRSLPPTIRQKLMELRPVFESNPFDPQLNTKKLKGELKSLFSFRITNQYRLLFQFTSKEEIYFLKIKHRKDIYN